MGIYTDNYRGFKLYTKKSTIYCRSKNTNFCKNFADIRSNAQKHTKNLYYSYFAQDILCKVNFALF